MELPKLASVTPERMTSGELFLDAMRNLHVWDDRPAAYSDKSLDRLFAESTYGGLTDEEQAKHDKQMTTERVTSASKKIETAPFPKSAVSVYKTNLTNRHEMKFRMSDAKIAYNF